MHMKTQDFESIAAERGRLKRLAGKEKRQGRTRSFAFPLEFQKVKEDLLKLKFLEVPLLIFDPDSPRPPLIVP